MKPTPGAYYPPRSRGHHRWRIPFYRLRYRIERFRDAMLLKGAWTPEISTLGALGKSLLLPGYVFFTMHQRVRWMGGAILAGYGLLLFLFLVELGTPLANVAFGLMIALHVTSICYVLEQMANGLTLLKRVGLAIIVLAIMGGMVYRPLLGQMQTHLFMPIHLNNQIYVVKTFAKPDVIRPGTRVVYKMPGLSQSLLEPGVYHGSIYVYNGLGIGTVLAEGGDHLKFTSEGMLVNNVALPHSAYMPTQTALIVPEKHWFIWPEFDIKRRDRIVSDRSLSDFYFRLAIVPKDQFVGTICKRWFWRRMD